MRPPVLIALAAAAVVAGCTWVKLTPGGEKVRVLESSEVASCKHVGKTTAYGKAKVAGIQRDEVEVAWELESLARNSAAEMGGDTIVPATPVTGDKRVFDVYRCVGP